MSVLGKKPFVNKIIESLSTEQIVKLRKLIDNPTDLRTIALYGVDNLLSENDKGVHFVKCKLEELSLRIVQGFLCYTDENNCAIFVFNNGSDIVEEYVIYPKVRKFERVYEYLNAEEFRRVLDDSEEEKGGSEAWSESMKDKMVFNSETNTVEIGTNLYVDGKISLSGVNDLKEYVDTALSNYAEKIYVDNQLNLCVKLTDIDTDLSLTSTNPIQNKVISKQIKDINYTIMTIKEELFETVLSEIDYKVDYATIYPIPETLSDNDGTHRVVFSDTQLKEVEGNSVAFNQLLMPYNSNLNADYYFCECEDMTLANCSYLKQTGDNYKTDFIDSNCDYGSFHAEAYLGYTAPYEASGKGFVHNFDIDNNNVNSMTYVFNAPGGGKADLILILQSHRQYVLNQKMKWEEYLQNLDNKIEFYKQEMDEDES